MNDLITIEIMDLTSEGKGVGRYDGLAVFVPGAIPGEKVKVKITNKKKSYAEAELIEIIQPSPRRKDSIECTAYEHCGGCQLMHMDYNNQLNEKTQLVQKSLERIGGFLNVRVKPCLGMDNPFGYRNKVVYQVGIRDNQLRLGFFSEKSNEFVPVTKCLLVSEIMGSLAQEIEKLINLYKLKDLKRVLIRESKHNGEILIGLIFFKEVKNKNLLDSIYELTNTLIKSFPQIVSIIKFIQANPKVPWSGTGKILFGQKYFTEEIGGKKFIISANSFFQVNSLQAEKLFNTVVDYCGDMDKHIVFDLYCGTGTISIFLADKAKKIYGIEALPEAVADASENARLNGLHNIEFIAGKVEHETHKLTEQGKKPQVIVIDPPRKGCHPKTIDTILKISPPKVIYVSCNPATLARDLKLLSEVYIIKQVQPVDMFPQTSHVETVVLMSRVEK